MPTVVDVTSYGAIMDGVTDGYAAITNALASSAKVVIPNGGLYVSQPVVVPAGKEVCGLASNHGPNTGFSSYIIGANGLNEVVVVDGGGGNLPVTVRGLGITRKPGPIPPGSKGLVLRRGDHVLIEDVQSHHHGKALQLEAQVRLNISRFCSFDVSEEHVNILGGIEPTFDNCRFGRNGVAGAQPTSYFRITGSPDTLRVKDCTFADNSGLVNHGFLFDNYSGPNGIFMLTNNHIEQMNHLLVTYHNVTVQRVILTGNSINIPGCLIAGADDPNWDFREFIMSGNNIGDVGMQCFPYVNGAVSGNNFAGSVTVQGGMIAFGSNTVQGDLNISGQFSRGRFGFNAVGGQINFCSPCGDFFVSP